MLVLMRLWRPGWLDLLGFDVYLLSSNHSRIQIICHVDNFTLWHKERTLQGMRVRQFATKPRRSIAYRRITDHKLLPTFFPRHIHICSVPHPSPSPSPHFFSNGRSRSIIINSGDANCHLEKRGKLVHRQNSILFFPSLDIRIPVLGENEARPNLHAVHTITPDINCRSRFDSVGMFNNFTCLSSISWFNCNVLWILSALFYKDYLVQISKVSLAIWCACSSEEIFDGRWVCWHYKFQKFLPQNYQCVLFCKLSALFVNWLYLFKFLLYLKRTVTKIIRRDWD